ncbi:MAG: hypothetical protein KC420_00970 [Myxococcales bacterium]|nr:hypothetical protein [Myxococcales bacterium]
MISQAQATPSTVTYDSVLSQDFITSNGVIVDASKSGQVAVFRNPHKGDAVEALVLIKTQIFYLAHDPTSRTGWSLGALRDSSGKDLFATEIIAFATTWGVVDAFYIGTGGHLSHLWIDAASGDWTAPIGVGNAPANLSQLAVAFSPGASESQGALVVYAVDPGGNVFFNYGSKSLWSPSTMPLGGAASSWTLALRDESRWLLTMIASETFIFRPGGGTPIGGVQPGQAAWAWGGFSDGKLSVAGGHIDDKHSAEKVILNATDMAGTPATMILMLEKFSAPGGGGPISWLINPGASDQGYGTVSGTKFIDATIVKSTNGFVNVYGIDPDLNLFTLRQIGFNPSDMGSGFGETQTWGPLLQLDARMERMYADVAPGDTPALMGVDADLGALHLYVQDPSTSLWMIVPVTLPTASKFEITRWRTEINLYDQDGQPMANAAFRLNAASVVDIDVNGTFQVIDSDLGAELTTNALGKATISSLATSLAPPALTVSADGLPAQGPHSPAGPLNDYFAGTGDLLGKPTFGAGVVQQLSPASSSDAEAAANAIKLCAQLGQAPGSEGDLRLQAARTSPQPIHVFTRSAKGVRHHRCTSGAEADALVAADLGASSIWSDVWDATKHFAGDVWNGIKDGLHKVASVIVDLEKSAVRLAIYIGDQLVTLADWVIKGVEDALQAVTAVFNWIKAEVEKVIDWLKMLFDFQAIWNTKEALKTQLLRLPDYLISQFASWSELIANGFFARQKAQIDGFFNAAISRYEGQAFTNLDGWSPMGQPPSSSATIAGAAVPSDLTNNASVNWFQDKVSSNAPAQIDGIPATSGDPIQAFFDSLVDVGQDLLQAFTDFGDGVVGLLKAESVDSFEDIAISTLLKLARDLVDTVLDLFDAIIQGLLALATLAMKGLAAAMNAELQLGFINDVYAWVASKAGGSTTLTMGDLVALIAAFPVTLIYKLINGVDSQPFPGGQPPTSAPAALAVGDPSATVQQVFGTVAGVLTAIGAVWTTVSDVMQPAPGWLTPVSWGTTAIRVAFTHPQFLDWGPLEWGTSSAIAANLLWLGPLAYHLNDMYKINETITNGVNSRLQAKGLTNWVFDDVKKIGSSIFGLFTLGNTIYALTQTSTPPLKASAEVVDVALTRLVRSDRIGFAIHGGEARFWSPATPALADDPTSA